MKCICDYFGVTFKESRPARGGWIEILLTASPTKSILSRPARGGWIEMKDVVVTFRAEASPAPHGAGGLKSRNDVYREEIKMSRPARGGWIEIRCSGSPAALLKSRPARGGWIEMARMCGKPGECGPAPHGAGGLK